MQTILLLHGAIGSDRQLEPLAVALSEHYKVYTLQFSGHGGRPFAEEPFSIQLFAKDVLAFMDDAGLEKVSIFGYSMGGYVGMYLAKHYPDKVDKLVTLATKYHWDEPTAAKEVQMLNPEKIKAKIPAFAATLEERHAPQNWEHVMTATADMMLALGKDNTLKAEDYSNIEHASLIMLGDRDKMVSMDETVQIYKTLPNAALAILPATPHPLEQVDVNLLASMIRQFIK